MSSHPNVDAGAKWREPEMLYRGLILSLLTLPLLSGGVGAQTGAGAAPSVCMKMSM